MRDEHEDSAAAAGEQLPLQVEPDATPALRGSGRRRRRRAVEIPTTQSGMPEPGPLGYFVIFLFLLSHEPKSQAEWPGLPFTLEFAAKHHALIFEDEE